MEDRIKVNKNKKHSNENRVFIMVDFRKLSVLDFKFNIQETGSQYISVWVCMCMCNFIFCLVRVFFFSLTEINSFSQRTCSSRMPPLFLFITHELESKINWQQLISRKVENVSAYILFCFSQAKFCKNNN